MKVLIANTTSQGAANMRMLSVYFGLALVLSVLTATSRADLWLVETNNNNGSPLSFDGSSAIRTVTFTNPIIPVGATILDIEVTVSFSKLSIAPIAIPNFNEVGFTLKSSEAAVEFPGSQLIKNGPGGDYSNGRLASFTPGFVDPGFNGTIVFNQTASLFVNQANGPNGPGNDIVAGIFKPIDPLTPFIGLLAANNTFSLTIDDSFNPGGNGSPLVLSSFSVAIRVVPEPSSLACLGLLAPAGAFIRRRRKR